jgi:MFS family permease
MHALAFFSGKLVSSYGPVSLRAEKICANPRITGAFYLPLYYQVLGASAMKAGVEMLPYSLGCAFTSAVAGIMVTRTGRYREMMWVSFAVFTIGMGLMTMLDGGSST